MLDPVELALFDLPGVEVHVVGECQRGKPQLGGARASRLHCPVG